MMRLMKADLHVHTLLSPCAAAEMTPRNIVRYAVQCGVDIVAITDHNACDNVPAAMEAAKGTGVTILPAMEVETKEEVHLVVLFDTLSQIKQWENFVNDHRLGLLNDEIRFGPQIIVDAWDEFVAMKSEMLLSSLSCGIEEVTSEVSGLGGICIASHVDRPMYSIISQLGFIPAGAKLTAVEVSRRIDVTQAAKILPAIGALPVITASDAHTVTDFIRGPKTTFFMEQPTLAEIKQALSNENMRKVVI